MLSTMRLERLFTHRIIRVLQYVLPLVVGVLVAIPLWTYWTLHNHQPKQVAKASPLAKGLSLLSEGVTFSQMDKNRKVFTVHAKSDIRSSDNKSLIQDVEVTIYGDKESDPPRHVKSKECNYDQKSSDIQYITCRGDVELDLADGTRATTQEVIYNRVDGLLTSKTPIQFERTDSTAGSANMLEYGLSTGLLRLAGDVKIHSSQGIDLESAIALFQQKENWATASGGVLMKSQNGWVRGDEARAELAPDSHQPQTIVVNGNVSAETHPPGGGSATKVRAGWMKTTMSATGVAEHVSAKTAVEVDKVTPDGMQTLTGNEVEASLDETGKVDLVESRGAAHLNFGSDRSLSSEYIRSNATGRVETEAESSLHVGTSVVTGRRFVIQQNGDVVTFNTPNRAKLVMDQHQSIADTTEAEFDSRTNQLTGLKQNGDFQFTQDDRHGHSQKATVEDNGSTLILEGAAVVTDPKMHLEAGRVRITGLNDKSQNYEATEHVKTLTAGSDGVPVLVKSDRAEGVDDNYKYSGNVQFWRDNAYIQSDNMDGSAAEKVLHARGRVRSDFDNFHASADTLDIDNDTRVAHYVGNVHARTLDRNIDAADMTVKGQGAGNALSEITGKGKVLLTKGEYRGTGDQVVYDATTDRAVLTGARAQVNDRKGSVAQGTRIVVNVAGDRMAVVEQRGESQYKVKK